MLLTEQILQYILHKQGDFSKLALAVFRYQYEHCLPYQRYCQQLQKTPEDVSTWQQIPAVSTEVFREFALCTLPISTAQYVFQTSGTSQDNKGRHYYHDMTLYDATIKMRFMSGLGLSNNDSPIFRVLTPAFSENPHSSLSYMFQKVLEWFGAAGSRFYFQNNEMDAKQLAQDLMEDIQYGRAPVLLGTAFSFINFCDYLQEINLALPTGSRLLETGGLKGRTRSVTRTELYQLLMTKLGLAPQHCFSEYGMTELSSQCYSRPSSHVFLSPYWMPTRIVDPEQGNEVAVGETGLVQFFDLANLTAISAVLTSDLAIRHQQGFELIGRAPKAVIRGCSTAFEE